jgi:hypothetical protein
MCAAGAHPAGIAAIKNISMRVEPYLFFIYSPFLVDLAIDQYTGFRVEKREVSVTWFAQNDRLYPATYHYQTTVQF